MEKVTDFIFLGSKITVDSDCSHEIKRCLVSDITLLTRSAWSVLAFSSSHAQVWGLDHKGGWVLKTWYFWAVVLEKTLESPLDSKEIKSVNPKGNQSWIFIGRIDVEAEAPILWPPDLKCRLIGIDPNAGKGWRQEKGMTEDEMALLTQWTWVWARSRRWWRTGKPGVLQFMGSQRLGHGWVTEQQQNSCLWNSQVAQQ